MPDPVEEIRAASRAALPPMEGELAVAGLAAPVEVRRDRWGIPYIAAASLEDLWFAQGFVTASERLFQIELALRVANGRLSELFSSVTVEQDRFARVIDLNGIGRAEVARWSDASRSMLRRYIEGVRAWIAAMPAPPVEYLLLGTAPELPEDAGDWIAALAFAAWGLSGNWDSELLRAHLREGLGPEAARALLPPAPAVAPGLAAGGLAGRLLDAVPRSRGQGSNEWVVSGSRTDTGRPLLANDPHLLVQQPGAWFELHLRAPGYACRGVAFPFLPGILVGVTEHHAWGITNVTGDVQDLYEERLDDDGTAAEFGGRWEPLSCRREEIGVRGGDPVAFDVRETRHGPLLEVEPVGLVDLDYVPLETSFALRWTATEGLLEPASLIDAAKATSFPAFRESLRSVSCPGQNVVYADVDGTIGYQVTGRYPIRTNGDGATPAPGWDGEHEWTGWIPFEELPWSMDPDRGFIVTANNRTYEPSYPHAIGLDFHTPFRAERIAERLASEDPATAEGSATIQLDTVSIAASRLLPRLTSAPPTSVDQRWALDLLDGWDADQASDSAAAAVYNVWLHEIGVRLFEAAGASDHADRYLAWREVFVCTALPRLLGGAPPTWTGLSDWDELLLDALDAALERLTDRLGRDRTAWRWGGLHRVRFAHPLARMPGLEPIFVAAEHELGGDEQTVLQAGFDGRSGFEPAVVPSYRVVVELADVDRTRAVLPTGQSGHPASAHWNDQASMWSEGRLRPAPVSQEAVRALADRLLFLHPR